MLDAFLNQQAHQRLREDLPGFLGVILIDVDRFGRLSEMLGRGGGDAVLRAVAGALGDAVRHSDLLGRYGGEEFCLVVPHATTDVLADAGRAAARRRRRARDRAGRGRELDGHGQLRVRLPGRGELAPAT